MIPDALLDQIQDRLDIVEVISGFVPLRHAGKNFKACCPFHHEKSPSFIVNPDKQIFHCFGCGVGGNVFTFLMKFEKRDFLEVVETLADRVGVEIPKTGNRDRALEDRQDAIYGINDLALDFYHQFLLTRPEAETARVYLAGRGIDTQTIRDFKIGFAPEGWDALYQFLNGKIAQTILEKSGLFLAKKEGGFYDRFRRRVIFPIIDLKGHCVAFGGRVLDDSVPKYLNSPETEIYSKGRNLYGLYQARQAIRENDLAIMVEGYMDLIACTQAGVKNVAASLGTALTPDQVRLVKRHTHRALILYDADTAGEMATLRGLELFLLEGVDVKILRLPNGHDPDSFVRQGGSEGFRKILETDSKSVFEYKLDLLKEKFDARTLEGRVKIANDMVTLLAKVQNEILKAAWTKELGGRLGLSEEALAAEMRKTKSEGVRSYSEPTDRTKCEAALIRPAEKMLVGLLLREEDFIPRAKAELSSGDFENPKARRIIETIFKGDGLTRPAHLINEYPPEDDMGSFISMVCAEAENTSNRQKAFWDCLTQLKRYRIKTQRQWLLVQIQEAQSAGDETRINQFMADLNHLNKKENINEKK